MRELFRQAVKAALHRAFDYGPLTETFHRTEELQNLQTATRLVGTESPEHLRSSFKACYHSGWGDVFYVIAANAKTKPEDARKAWDLALMTYSMHKTPEKARTFLETRLKSYDQSIIPEHEDIFVRTAMDVVAAFLAAGKFSVEPIITDGDKLPGYLWCGGKCKHLSSEGADCYLFRQPLKSAPSKGKYLRCKKCVSYVEGLT